MLGQTLTPLDLGCRVRVGWIGVVRVAVAGAAGGRGAAREERTAKRRAVVARALAVARVGNRARRAAACVLTCAAHCASTSYPYCFSNGASRLHLAMDWSRSKLTFNFFAFRQVFACFPTFMRYPDFSILANSKKKHTHHFQRKQHIIAARHGRRPRIVMWPCRDAGRPASWPCVLPRIRCAGAAE